MIKILDFVTTSFFVFVALFSVTNYKRICAHLTENGGLKSACNWFYIFLVIWSLYTFFREQGWLPKKKVQSKHVFITGAGSGLG